MTETIPLTSGVRELTGVGLAVMATIRQDGERDCPQPLLSLFVASLVLAFGL